MDVGTLILLRSPSPTVQIQETLLQAVQRCDLCPQSPYETNSEGSSGTNSLPPKHPISHQKQN